MKAMRNHWKLWKTQVSGAGVLIMLSNHTTVFTAWVTSKLTYMFTIHGVSLQDAFWCCVIIIWTWQWQRNSSQCGFVTSGWHHICLITVSVLIMIQCVSDTVLPRKMSVSIVSANAKKCYICLSSRPLWHKRLLFAFCFLQTVKLHFF